MDQSHHHSHERELRDLIGASASPEARRFGRLLRASVAVAEDAA